MPVFTWEPSTPLSEFPRVALKEFEMQRTPILFKGVPLESWGGEALWAPPKEHLEALIKAADETARPKVSNDSFFQYFFTPKVEEWRSKWNREPPRMSFAWDTTSPPRVLRKLLEGTRDDSAEKYGYWILKSDMVPDIDAALREARPSVRDAFGSPALQARTVSPVTAQPLSQMNINVWVTSPGVANNMHFDVDWNYLVHASGPKRVLLAPPKDAQNLLLYPRAHPSLRSSPIDLRQTDWNKLLAERPSLANVSFLEVELQPRDVLLIPPYWLHFIHVGDDAPATSYSFFSSCLEGEFLHARIPSPRNAAEGLARSLSLLNAFFADEKAAATLSEWGLNIPLARPVEEDGVEQEEEQEEDEDEEGMLDLGPNARRKKPASAATTAVGLARRFVSDNVLSKSLRATPEMARIFCAHDEKPARARRPKRCPEPGQQLGRMSAEDARAFREVIHHQHLWADHLRRLVSDRAIRSIIAQSELEDLAYHAWGPKDSCEMIERCILPLLDEEQ